MYSSLLATTLIHAIHNTRDVGPRNSKSLTSLQNFHAVTATRNTRNQTERVLYVAPLVAS